MLAEGLAEELASRRDELRPEMERCLIHLGRYLDKLPEEQRALVEGYYRRQGIEALAGESKRTVDATYKMLWRVRHALQGCVQTAAQREEATA